MEDKEIEAHKFNSKMIDGKIRVAAQGAMCRETGEVYFLDDTCPKTGQEVIKVLRTTHPPMRNTSSVGGKRGRLKLTTDSGVSTAHHQNQGCVFDDHQESYRG